MEIVTKKDGTQTILQLDGKIDANTAPALQNAILQAFQSEGDVVLDMEKVQYVSSAGLRALLIGQKTAASKKAEFMLIHVSPKVKTVLEVVGFADVIKIVS